MNKPSNTLAIIGLVLGIIAILFSFIPCVGTIAFLPGIVGAILGVIAYLKAKDNGHPKGLSLAVIIVSLVACAISFFQMFALKNLAEDMKDDKKIYLSCEDLSADYEIVKSEMKTLTKEMENDSPSLSNITKVAKLGFKLDNIQKQSDKLGCNINVEDFDVSEKDEMEDTSNSDGEKSNQEEQDDNENQGQEEQ